jgi:hypothetical protein
MKGVITIFAMPQELEDLALTLNMLKRNSVFRDKSVDYKLDITMCLSNELTDWGNSKLPMEYFENRTRELVEKYCDWCEYKTLTFEKSNGILGCVSQRRMSLENNSDADFFIWLDCDFTFKDTTLFYSVSSYKMLKEAGMDTFVITPQFVKQWDNTWDVIVNERFWNHQLDYELVADVYEDTLPQIGEVAVKEIETFKFAGGWFTLISADLLKKIGVPESLGHYGLEDTFVIECAKIMKSKGEPVSQFIMENLLIGESYTHRPNETIKSFISSKNRKAEFTKIANDNFANELKNFYERSYGSTNGL